ncbi:MAG TPA: hypothetical protein VKE92_13375, partial [Anaerolineales bacterium]|nr:hypothetical protein [Anaerolineales bacterium]
MFFSIFGPDFIAFDTPISGGYHGNAHSTRFPKPKGLTLKPCQFPVLDARYSNFFVPFRTGY